MDNANCAILVPVAHSIEPDCDRALLELELKGYPVRRVWGYSQVDVARSEIATKAISDGFEELMWIDSDVAFDPKVVDRLRSHDLPVVCGIYPNKGQQSLACYAIPGTTKMTFGDGGGLIEILYAATGFLLTRRQVYIDIQEHEGLPLCNTRSRPMLPFFMPMIVPDGDSHWYLGDDFSFSERIRRCGYKIFADTTIRLWHIGRYGYSWEEAGTVQSRYASFHFDVK
jgi:hypothetical protein